MPTLIETLYSDCQGYLDVRALKKGSKPKQTFILLGEWTKLKAWMSENKDHDLYFGVSTRDGKGGKKANIVHIPAVYVDVDFKTIPGGENSAVLKINEFPLQPTIRVMSGGGIHLYWKLKEPEGPESIEKVEAVMRGLAMRLDGDMASTDASRILRIPNTQNYKYLPPRKVYLQHCNGSEYLLDDFESFIDTEIHEIPKDRIPEDQKVTLGRIMRCRFMQHCKADAATLPEPEWRAMITQIMKEVGGIPLIHQLSKPYPKYKPSETDKKVLDAIANTGPHTCEQIKKLWDCGCQCEVRAPAALSFLDPQDDLDGEQTEQTGQTEQTFQTGQTGTNREQTANKPEQTSESLSNKMQMVKDWLETCDGVFTIQDVASELQFTRSKNPREYNRLKLILKELTDKKLLERVGSTRGVYRKIEQTIEEMNWWECTEDLFYKIKLPLELNDIALLYPKNIVVIAGEKNSAKTALALTIAMLNIDTHDVHFFNSETSKHELRDRLTCFNMIPLEKWRKVHFYETDNFLDHIRPDSLNIVDYLEVHEDFYKVGGMIRKAHDKLNTGVAVICMQKKPGQDAAKGGETTLEKARLYISLTLIKSQDGRIHNQAKIVKCKKPAIPGIEPYGWVLDFHIYNGAELKMDMGYWHTPQGAEVKRRVRY